MDVGALSTGLAMSSVGNQVDVGVLKAIQNLDKTMSGELFASIGLGKGVDAYA